MICVSLLSPGAGEMPEEARRYEAEGADVLELRADGWDFAEDPHRVFEAVQSVRGAVNLPLLLTCRDRSEGGFRPVSDGAKLEMLSSLGAAGVVDFIDGELSMGEPKLRRLKSCFEQSGTMLVVSHHDFSGTPDAGSLIRLMGAEIRSGGDIAKLAVTPHSAEDVLNLMTATLEARRKFPAVPLVTVSMGPLGVVSRVAGGLFGSDLTFAAGIAASGPGQLLLTELKEAMEPLYRD